MTTTRYRYEIGDDVCGVLASASTRREAKSFIEDLTLQDLDNPLAVWNAFGLEELEDDGQYHEWYDEEGNSITHDDDDG